jgi:hypothetical protein
MQPGFFVPDNSTPAEPGAERICCSDLTSISQLKKLRLRRFSAMRCRGEALMEEMAGRACHDWKHGAALP